LKKTLGNRSSFVAELKRQFFPVLKQAGFDGTGQTRIRVHGLAYHVIHLWAPYYGGMVYVDCGLHFRFLPREGEVERKYNFEELVEPNCAFRTRLLPLKEFADKYQVSAWTYGLDTSFAAAAVSALAQKFLSEIEPEYAEYSQPENILSKLTSSIVGAGDYGKFRWGFHPTSPQFALNLARVALHLERYTEAAAFAKHGLLRSIVEEQQKELNAILNNCGSRNSLC
jgi:hypothetical protein